MAKRAMTGLKGVALMPITTNTAASYATNATGTIDLPYAGSMSRTVKERTQDIYYDDELYASVKDSIGEDVEIRFAEVELSKLAEMGLGEYDEQTGTLDADFNVQGKEYALGCICNTVSNLPMYLRWRLFTLSSIAFDTANTRKDSMSVCEVIIKGVLGRPMCAQAKPWSIREAKTPADVTECETWLRRTETLPSA